MREFGYSSRKSGLKTSGEHMCTTRNFIFGAVLASIYAVGLLLCVEGRSINMQHTWFNAAAVLGFCVVVSYSKLPSLAVKLAVGETQPTDTESQSHRHRHRYREQRTYTESRHWTQTHKRRRTQTQVDTVTLTQIQSH